MWVETAGGPARVEIDGDGDPVVLVGSAVPMAWARPAAQSIAGRGFRVVNFDYGPPDGWEGKPLPRTCLAQVPDVLDVMRATGASPAAVVGLSRGAITAHALAARHPEKVSHLILAFPVAGFADTLGIEGEQPSMSDDPMEALDAALDVAFSSRFLESNRQAARDLFLAPPGTVVRVERVEEVPLMGDAQVVAPTLIISGGEDRVVTPEHPGRLRKAIPHADLHEFRTASHGFIMERPDEFSQVVADFLRSWR